MKITNESVLKTFRVNENILTMFIAKTRAKKESMKNALYEIVDARAMYLDTSDNSFAVIAKGKL